MTKAGFAAAILVGALACATSGAPSLEHLAGCLQGSFDNAAQAAADPEHFSDIRLEMVRIWPERTDGIWLYVEQAEAAALERPYRQRVLHLTALPDGRFLSSTATFADPLRFALAWQQPSRFAALRPEDLDTRTGCGVFLTADTNGIYRGGTVAKACPSSLRGASYATTEVTVAADRMISWDRGYDAQDRQVWGAVKGAYVFRKRDRLAPR
jgi:CpeT protein